MKKFLALTFASVIFFSACGQTSDTPTTPAGTPPSAETPAPTESPSPAPVAEPTAPATEPSPAPQAVKAEVKVEAKVETKVITLDAGNLYFNPKSLTVKMNQPVKVNYTNKGTHSFSVDELGVNVPLTASSGSFTFTPKKKGTFSVYCNIPGHKQAGMIGTIVVE